MAALLLLISPAPSPSPSPLPQQQGPALRALLIGSDTFLSRENTYPIAQNNLSMLEHALEKDIRGYKAIHTYHDEIGHPAALERAIESAFAHAEEDDISLLYFSSHGIDPETGKSGLYLSDGMEETILTPEQLYALTSSIPGKKIILLDACNSGAFIGKGSASLSVSHPFTGSDYLLITSAGASEASWQWQGEGELSSGSSYFTAMLASGLCGDSPADTNRDGQITMAELYAFISLNDAASTAYTYPESSPFPLFCYLPGTAAPTDAITGITLDETLLTAGQSRITFSFTIHRETRLYYQIVYYRNGAWDFENAQHFQDDETGSGFMTPGRKERALILDMANGQDYGYAMLQFIVVEEDIPSFHGSRLLCVQPQSGDPDLSVTTLPSFSPNEMQEMPLLISHAFPCGLSVTVKDIHGKTIRRLSYAQPTRPQQLVPPASLFYWDGTDNKGLPALPGRYYIQVQVRLGEEKYTAYSTPFTLEGTTSTPESK